MGYTTYFSGFFEVKPKLSSGHSAYLRKFSATRRMKRDEERAINLHDPERLAVNLPIGPDGGFYTGGADPFGQGHDSSILDYNVPPSGQPGLWCQWIPGEDNTSLEWDGGEKFYYYTEWLEYLIEHFLKPWGYNVNGEVKWRGEDFDDIGVIHVLNNAVSSRTASF